jgi:hypothetical protein
LHVVLVGDTDAKDYDDTGVAPTRIVAEGAQNDVLALEQLFKKGLGGRATVTVTMLVGADVTPAKVLRYFRDLRAVDETTGLVLYYSGHGGIDGATRQHALTFDSGTLWRADVREAMLARKPGFAAVITDCCSGYAAIRAVAVAVGRADVAAGFVPAEPEYPAEVVKTLDDLFLRHRGLVDVTAAADGTFAIGTAEGGLFTIATRDTVRQPRAVLDVSADKFVSWAEIWPVIQGNTNGLYRRGRPDPKQPDQIPRAFSIPLLKDPELPPPRPPVPSGTAMVGVTNRTGHELIAHLKWGDGKVEKIAFAPGASWHYRRDVDADGTAPPPLFTYESKPGNPVTIELLYSVTNADILRAEYAKPHSLYQNKKTGEVRLFADR